MPSRTACAELLETTDKLVELEHARTSLPVAIIGNSSVMNLYLQHRLGQAAREHTMPFKGGARAEKAGALRAITLPLGFICGYAGGVVGSNDFSIEDRGDRRFVRSLIVLGNIIPNLTNIAREHRGLFAHVLDAPVDWTQMYRTVPYAGTERDGEVLVAKNVIGFRDDAANAILYGAYEAELLQIVGRMRGQLADPVDPSIVPTVYVIGGIAVPGWDVDEVIGLADVRERLGLSVRERAQIGRPSKKPIEQQIADRCVKRGPEPTVLWLVKGLFPKYGESAVTVARHLVESTGRTVPHRVISAAAELVNELAAADRSGRR